MKLANDISLRKSTPVTNDHDFDFLVELVNTSIKNAKGSLFTTDQPDMFELFIGSLPREHRQYYNCNCCRRFINTYGTLVTLDERGVPTPAAWNFNLEAVPEFFQHAVGRIKQTLRYAKATGVFYSKEKVWGQPLTGPWNHLYAVPHSSQVRREGALTVSQQAAEKLEDFRMLNAALNDFNAQTVNVAVTLLQTDTLYRAEKVLGVATWFQKLQESVSANHKRRTNIVWSAVAAAPAGYCHVRSTMIGTLLEDLASGMNLTEARNRFGKKMHPLSYMRPKAAPAEGTINQAEKLVEKLGVLKSLERRYARLEDIEKIWTPRPAPRPVNGAFSGPFSHLRQSPTPTPRVHIPMQTMTWAKFLRDILPTATDIKLNAPYQGNYTAMVTAVHPDAPLIFQWDNPVSTYVYHGGSTAQHWGLSAGMTRVTAISYRPSMWGGNKLPNQPEGVIFVLQGARDLHSSHLGIFPETLKSEFHGIRSVIEAHAAKGRVKEASYATACGISFQKKIPWNVELEVSVPGATLSITIDRWE